MNAEGGQIFTLQVPQRLATNSRLHTGNVKRKYIFSRKIRRLTKSGGHSPSSVDIECRFFHGWCSSQLEDNFKDLFTVAAERLATGEPSTHRRQKYFTLRIYGKQLYRQPGLFMVS